MSYRYILCEVHENVGLIRINRPGQRNALCLEMIELNRQIAAELGKRAEAFWTMLAEVGLASITAAAVAGTSDEEREARTREKKGVGAR
jgi:hypothetical protein